MNNPLHSVISSNGYIDSNSTECIKMFSSAGSSNRMDISDEDVQDLTPKFSLKTKSEESVQLPTKENRTIFIKTNRWSGSQDMEFNHDKSKDDKIAVKKEVPKAWKNSGASYWRERNEKPNILLTRIPGLAPSSEGSTVLKDRTYTVYPKKRRISAWKYPCRLPSVIPQPVNIYTLHLKIPKRLISGWK